MVDLEGSLEDALAQIDKLKAGNAAQVDELQAQIDELKAVFFRYYCDLKVLDTLRARHSLDNYVHGLSKGFIQEITKTNCLKVDFRALRRVN